MHPSRRIQSTRSSSLSGKRIILGVSGSIAAVRTVELSRELIRRGAEVRAVMTPSATRILHPYALEYATGHPVCVELSGQVEHITWVEEADLLLLAPCTANTIGKMAGGVDDTPVATCASVALGLGKPIVVAPAMHEPMARNPAVARNLERLHGLGVHLVAPRVEEEALKVADTEAVVLEVERFLSEGRLRGRRVLVTGGPTVEAIDPIRVLSNRSSGRTGVELAKEAYRQGAEVVLVHNGTLGLGGIREHRVVSAREMEEAVVAVLGEEPYDLLVMAAAVSDFTVRPRPRKIPSGARVVLELEPAPKVIQRVRREFPGVGLVAFKAETGLGQKALVAKAREALRKSGALLVAANDVARGGMGTEENTLVAVPRRGAPRTLRGSKAHLARGLLEMAARLLPPARGSSER